MIIRKTIVRPSLSECTTALTQLKKRVPPQQIHYDRGNSLFYSPSRWQIGLLDPWIRSAESMVQTLFRGSREQMSWSTGSAIVDLDVYAGGVKNNSYCRLYQLNRICGWYWDGLKDQYPKVYADTRASAAKLGGPTFRPENQRHSDFDPCRPLERLLVNQPRAKKTSDFVLW